MPQRPSCQFGAPAECDAFGMSRSKLLESGRQRASRGASAAMPGAVSRQEGNVDRHSGAHAKRIRQSKTTNSLSCSTCTRPGAARRLSFKGRISTKLGATACFGANSRSTGVPHFHRRRRGDYCRWGTWLATNHLSGQRWPNFGQIWTIRLQFGHVFATSVESGPNLANIWPTCAELGRIRPDFGQIWHGLVETWAELGTRGVDLADYFAIWVEFGSTPANIWSELGQFRPNSCEFGRLRGTLSQI